MRSYFALHHDNNRALLEATEKWILLFPYKFYDTEDFLKQWTKEGNLPYFTLAWMM